MNAEYAVLASELLSVSGIERVFSIDDLHRPGAKQEELLGMIATMEAALLEQHIAPLLILDTDDRLLIRDTIRARWDTLTEPQRDALLMEAERHSRNSSTGEKISNDVEVATKLPAIFTKNLRMMPYRDWISEEASLLSPDMPSTLLLVDLDYSGEDVPGNAGIALIKRILLAQPEARIFCGLLTNRYGMTDVHGSWRGLCEEHGLDGERFVLVPKDALHEDVPRFLALVKLVVLSGHARQLTNFVKTSYENSVRTALEEMGKIDAYEFEQIVCVSSAKEGVWEPDTLVRIFSVYHQRSVHEAMHAEPEAYRLANLLRRLSNVKTGTWGSETPRGVKLRRLEWFIEPEELNRHTIPLELGDIFRVTARPDKIYVLVSQPCDLMVRQNGDRDGTVQNATLLEGSRNVSGEEGGFGFQLAFFEEKADWRVNLRKTTTIALEVLDLCALNHDGFARISADGALPDTLNSAWTNRVPRLKKWAAAIIRKHADLVQKRLPHNDADKLSTTAWMGRFATGKVDAQHQQLSYDVQRIGRLRQPRASALLSRFADAIARDAFDHDLVRREPPQSPPSQSEAEVEGTR